MNKNGCTFEVADVPLSSDLVAMSPARGAIFDLLTRDFRQITSACWELPSCFRGIARHLQSAQIGRRGIEACSGEDRRLMTGVSFHPLVFAAHVSFCFHYPLTLSPDMIWLLIVQGVAEHVNANASKLRAEFVQHQGRLLIGIDRNDLIRGLPGQPWQEVIAQFAARIRDHIGETTSDLFVPRFSTTGENEKTACQVALMYGLGQYFELKLKTICGIPRITLEGRPDDWSLLVERVSAFRRFDLDWWLNPLEVVLRQFALASEGEVNRSCWNSLYQMQSGSGSAAYSGWLGIFFPYLRDKQGNTSRNDLVPPLARYLSEVNRGGEKSQDPETQPCFPRPWSLPKGITAAPFEWEYYDQTIPMEFLGGFIGVVQDQETLALRPEIGWAVRDKPKAHQRLVDDDDLGMWPVKPSNPPANPPSGPPPTRPPATVQSPLSKGLQRFGSFDWHSALKKLWQGRP